MNDEERDEAARAAIAEYRAFIKANPRDPLNKLLRETIKRLRSEIRRRQEVRRLVDGRE